MDYTVATLLLCILLFTLALRLLTVLPAAIFAFILFVCPLRWRSTEEIEEERRLQHEYDVEKEQERERRQKQKQQRERPNAEVRDQRRVHSRRGTPQTTMMIDGDGEGTRVEADFDGSGIGDVLKQGLGRRVVVEWRC